jgi:hypothetical protein
MLTDSAEIEALTYISLGGDCAVSYQIKKYYNSPSYPFDWIRTETIDSLCKIFEDDFSNFFDESNFIVKPNTINSYSNDDECNYSSNYKIINKFYNIVMPHEYISDTFDINNFILKYKRRIERFKNDIRNKFKKKIFIRCSNSKYLNTIDKNRLLNTIISYGGVNFSIQYINYDNYNSINYTWKRDYIKWNEIIMK